MGSMLHFLDISISSLKGIGPKREKILNDQGVSSLKDILLCLPRRYRVRPAPGPFSELIKNEQGAARGVVKSTRISGFGRRRNLKVTVIADEDEVELMLFNRAFLKGSFPKGRRLVFCGKLTENKGRLQMLSPDYHLEGDPGQGFPGLVPIYSLPSGLYPRTFHRFIQDILERLSQQTVQDWRTQAGLKDRNLMDLLIALKEIHNPTSLELAEQARRRIAYEEFFAFQLSLTQKKEIKKTGPMVISKALEKNYFKCLPFILTGAQKRAIEEIREDLNGKEPMHRLLQGDVGSGKTAVALYPLLAGALSGGQSAFMAPTEVLASQHFEVLKKLMQGLKVQPVYLRAGLPIKEIRAILNHPDTGVVVGTHALIQERIQFPNLKVCVIDEQHKFGVKQRWNLRLKGESPHVLVMTATPIPRSLALTLYGELDVTILDESPPGRKPVATFLAPSLENRDLKAWLKREDETGGRVFFVCPLVNESEKLDLEAAKTLYKKISGQFDRTGLLYGGLPSEEKNRILDGFRNGEIRFLVTTIVVEVGVDVPEASTVVILDAWRFGLAQLHQIRGRTGRGERESRCFLVGKPNTDSGKERLSIIQNNHNGFFIAEQDLKMRGPGEALGLRQHGLPLLKAGDYVEDIDLMVAARDDARQVQNLKSRDFLFTAQMENRPWIG